MGRSKIQLKKIENPNYRHITFSKRKSGLLKKAFELSTLCDIEIAVIIFSPAGKLFLYEGKKRLEQIYKHYVDLPDQQRGGRLQNQELIRRLIDQMNLEASIYHQLVTAGNDYRSPDEGPKDELHVCYTDLEEIEKQISYLLRSPSSIRTMIEAERYEAILDETLKHVQMRKQMLQSDVGSTSQPSSEGGLFQKVANPGGNMNMMASCSYNVAMPPPHIDPKTMMIDIQGPTGFQSFSNQIQAQPFPVTMQPSYPLSLMPMPQPQMGVGQFINDPYMPQPQAFSLGHFVNMNISPRMNPTPDQGMAAMAVQGPAGNNAVMMYCNPNYSKPGATDGNPFQV